MTMVQCVGRERNRADLRAELRIDRAQLGIDPKHDLIGRQCQNGSGGLRSTRDNDTIAVKTLSQDGNELFGRIYVPAWRLDEEVDVFGGNAGQNFRKIVRIRVPDFLVKLSK